MEVALNKAQVRAEEVIEMSEAIGTLLTRCHYRQPFAGSKILSSSGRQNVTFLAEIIFR
jgi:hypothetical protein